MPRPTPMQDYATHVVEENPGITPMDVADIIGPSRMFGYRTIWRAASNGRFHVVPRDDKRGCYRLYPVVD